jgi:hypothetical protein
VDRGIAQRIGSRAKTDEILVTMDALSGFYQRLVILAEELPQIDLLLRLANEDDAAKVYPGVADPSQLRRTRDVPIVTAQAQEHQSRRLSLPPLPEFPLESQSEQTQTKVAMQWAQEEWSPPQAATQMSPALHDATSSLVAPPSTNQSKFQK